MFTVRVQYGKGDRKARSVSDDLIRDEAMARIRGEQVLGKHLNIIHSRRLKTPHEPDIEVGTRKEFTHSKLGIWGPHQTTAVTINITPDAIWDQISAEQYTLFLEP